MDVVLTFNDFVVYGQTNMGDFGLVARVNTQDGMTTYLNTTSNYYWINYFAYDMSSCSHSFQNQKYLVIR